MYYTSLTDVIKYQKKHQLREGSIYFGLSFQGAVHHEGRTQ